MTEQEYFDFTAEMSYHPHDLTYLGLALSGECGEVADDIKKMLRDDNGQLTLSRRNNILLEAGDVLFYFTRLCDYLGVNYSDIMEMNKTKLLERRKRLDTEGTVGHIG